jgi:isocitrate lyase
MIAAGVAGSHWEDQLASEKKCGHLGGKVLIPTQQHIRTLTSARLAADVCDVPTVVIARTDAEAATLITSDVDERTGRSSPVSAPRRASTGPATASTRASRGPSPTRRMPT